MTALCRFLESLQQEDDGLTKVEYALLAALIVVIIITAYFTIGLTFFF